MLKGICVVFIVLQTIIMGIALQNCHPAIIVCICILSLILDILAFMGVVLMSMFYEAFITDNDFLIEYIEKMKAYKKRRKEKRLEFLKRMEALKEAQEESKQVEEIKQEKEPIEGIKVTFEDGK